MNAHLLRAALIAAGHPAWPAAIEVLERYGARRVRTKAGEVDFDILALLAAGPADVPADRCPVGRLGDRWVTVGADGDLEPDLTR